MLREPDCVAETDSEEDWERVGDGDAVAEEESVEEALGVCVKDADPDWLGDPLVEALVVWDRVASCDRVWEIDALPLEERLADGLRVGLCVSDRV